MQLTLLTYQGFVIKNLIDIIYQNFKNEICLECKHEGIFCEQISINNERMLKFELWNNSLVHYSIDQPFLIGIQLRQLVEILKSVRKLDTLKLTIQPGVQKLVITIINSDQQRQISNSIPVFEIQQIKTDTITGYDRFLTISSQEFSKLVKEISSLSSDIILQIFSNEKTLRIISRSCNISEKIITVGPDIAETPIFEQTFAFDFLNHLNRLNFISHQVKIYFHNNLPLKIQCNMNDRGKFEYFVNQKKPE